MEECWGVGGEVNDCDEQLDYPLVAGCISVGVVIELVSEILKYT